VVFLWVQEPTLGTPNVYEIGKLLPSVFRKQIRRAEPHLLEILIPLWPRIAGKPMAQHSQPAAFESGVLTLSTDCATWGTQLRQMTEEIRAEINSFLGQPAVRKLRIKNVTRLDLLPRTGRSGGAASPPPTPEDAAFDTTSIRDPEIAQVVASSYAKYFARQRR
jgi:hypothetical protein